MESFDVEIENCVLVLNFQIHLQNRYMRGVTIMTQHFDIIDVIN